MPNMDEQQPNLNELDQLKAQCEEYLSGWKRAQADYQNLKKDGERERADFAKYANERLLEDLLPVIDQFNIALAFIPDTSKLPEDQRRPWENWLMGIKAVKSLWDGVAKQVGLEEITFGSFDPNLHDAAGEEAVEGKATGEIIKVLQPGWKLNGKILKPARVIVAK